MNDLDYRKRYLELAARFTKVDEQRNLARAQFEIVHAALIEKEKELVLVAYLLERHKAEA